MRGGKGSQKSRALMERRENGDDVAHSSRNVVAVVQTTVHHVRLCGEQAQWWQTMQREKVALVEKKT